MQALLCFFSHFALFCFVQLNFALLGFVLLCSAQLCLIQLNFALLRFVLLCSAQLCFVKVCFAFLAQLCFALLGFVLFCSRLQVAATLALHCLAAPADPVSVWILWSFWIVLYFGCF